MHSYELCNRLEYFDYLISRYQQAQPGDNIILATLEFRPDQPAISEIVDALCVARDRGANVTFLVDAYPFMLKEGAFLGPLFFNKNEPKQGIGKFKPVIAAINKLREHDVTCFIMNKPVRPLKNPFSDRAHIKYAVINDEVFIGGCNLSHPNQLDVMVKTENSRLAAYMTDFTDSVIEHKSVRTALNRQDTHFQIDATTELLIDAGVRKQSIIYDKAFSLIHEATQSVYMTCQYFPNSYTPAVLAQAAERGVAVHLAYNHPHQHRSPIRGAQKRTVAYNKKRLPESVFENELHEDKNYLHAKILVSEKEAIIGSHNFVKMGVDLGTAEIALRSTSKDFIDLAQNWIKAL